MEIRIQRDFSELGRKIMCVTKDGQSGIYNFKTKEVRYLNSRFMVPEEDEVLELPEDVFNALAAAIKADETLPSPKKDYLEGKIESLTQHLEDMRGLVFGYLKLDKKK